MIKNKINFNNYKDFKRKVTKPNIYKMNVKILETLYLISTGDTKLKKKFREVLKLEKSQDSNVTFNSLTIEYWNLSNTLSKHYVLQDSYRTIYEHTAKGKLIKDFKFTIYHSFWIENFCLDIFIPSLKLAIEINGNIHDKEFKMKKDNLKESVLAELGIITFNIENENINERINDLIFHLKDFKKLQTNNKKRLMRNIFIRTLAKHYSTEDLSNIFSYDFSILQKILKNNR